MDIMQINARRRSLGAARNIIKSGVSPISVSPVNRRVQPVGGKSVRVNRGPHRHHRRRRPRSGWRIGAMSGNVGSAWALAAVLIGAYLLFHKR